jgi:hypothetical protein
MFVMHSKRETKRQKLKHALALERAGLQAPADSQLLKERQTSPQPLTAGMSFKSSRTRCQIVEMLCCECDMVGGVLSCTGGQ